MQIIGLNTLPNYRNTSTPNVVSKYNTKETMESCALNNNPIAHLNRANIAFGSMKKSQFLGIDLIMVNKLTQTDGLNIQKLNTNEDFQEFCQNILDEKYLGEDNIEKLSDSIDPQAREQKKKILSDWCDYVVNENDAYNPAIELFILSSITKTLDKTTNHLPPVLDKRKVADTIYEITEKTKTDKNYIPNFDKLYRNNLQKTTLQAETQLDENLNGWIVIPSKKHDTEHFEENVKKLQTLSHDSWCTKTYNAEPYLSDGDFHIYMEKGQPKLGVRFDSGVIQEIQGEKNDSRIPIKYLDIANSHINKENKYKLSSKAKGEFDSAKSAKVKITKIEKEVGEEIKNKKYDRILPKLGFKVKKDEDGMFILSHYKQPDKDYTFEDIGLDESDLFKHVKDIKGNADFRASKITSLDNIQSIGGDVLFGNKITSLGALQSIGGNVWFGNKITSLGNLQNIGGYASFVNSQITSLGNLQSIGGTVYFNDKLEEYLKNQLKDVLDKKEYSADDVKKIFNAIKIKYEYNENDNTFSINNYYALSQIDVNENELFKYISDIKGHASFVNCNATSLGNIQSIGDGANFSLNKTITSLGKLKHIDGDIGIINSNLKKEDFANIECIWGKNRAYYQSRLFLHLLKENLEYFGSSV